METILTFDVGTTAIKTSLFDQSLTPLASRTDEYNLISEHGKVELPSEVYWETICHAVQALGTECPLDTVAAICLTTQGETLIPIDKDGNALHNAVVWLDDRAKDQASEILRKTTVANCYDLTGVTDINGFVPLAKLLWFRQEQPDIYKKAYKFLLLEDYLLYRLTARFVTEKSLLTSTAYYDIRNDRYWTELLEQLDLDVGKLPEILDCGSLVGNITADAAAELGVPVTVRVFSGAMDQIAAAIGGGGMRENVVTATVGTAMVLTSYVTSMDECTNPALILYRGVQSQQYAILPMCPTSGAVFKWFKDQCCSQDIAECAAQGIDVYDKLCADAAEVAPGAEGVTLLPYFAGSLQPKCLPEAKGVFYGIGLTTNKKVLTRAVLESVGYMLRENLEMLNQYGISTKYVHFFGGGSKNPIWNQIISDITGIDLVLLEHSECGSMGAAMLGAVGLGWYPSLADAQTCNRVRQVIHPNAETKADYDHAYKRYQELLHRLMPMFKNGRE